MAKDYLKAKSQKKKSASRAGWIIVIFVIAFAAMIGKFALSSSNDLFTGLPDSDTAYGAAKQFILPTIPSRNVNFADGKYKFAKKSDSVYVIKSSYITKESNGEGVETSFKIVLKYNGGPGDQSSNWSLLNLDQDN